jgi:hypothetical protein
MTTPTISLVKKKTMGPKAIPAAKPGAVVNYQITDADNGSFTVNGVNAAGDVIDISSLATMTVTSDTPAVCTVAAPVGMGDQIQGLSVGTANLTIVVTFTSGTPAPLTVVQPVTVAADPNITGLAVNLGTPVVRP